MRQSELFGETDRIHRQGLSIELIRSFIPREEAQFLLEALVRDTRWEQPRVQVYGKWHLTPRLVSFHGEAQLAYAYSQIQHGAQPWTALLSGLKARVSEASGQYYNAVLLNYYRDGRDTMGWHADDEKELGDRPIIASLSLGAARDIHFKPKTGKTEPVRLKLPSGSLLIMRGDTQHSWLHHIPRRARCQQPRLNLTFRHIFPH